jgi:hypothetical protein
MPQTAARSALLVTALCWAIVVFDGYDLIVYGTVLPELLHEPGWGLTPGSAGLLGSLAFVGMLVGALGAGLLADRIGRRRAILISTVWFSLFTALCAAAQNPAMFGTVRFLAGVGLGGLIPSASALASEFVRPRLRAMVATLMMSGVPIGGTAAALIGRSVIPGSGWRVMFLIALIALVMVVPLCWFRLPESAAYLRSQGRTDEAAAAEARYGLVPAPAQHADLPPAGLRRDRHARHPVPDHRRRGQPLSLRAPWHRPRLGPRGGPDRRRGGPPGRRLAPRRWTRGELQLPGLRHRGRLRRNPPVDLPPPSPGAPPGPPTRLTPHPAEYDAMPNFRQVGPIRPK